MTKARDFVVRWSVHVIIISEEFGKNWPFKRYINDLNSL